VSHGPTGGGSLLAGDIISLRMLWREFVGTEPQVAYSEKTDDVAWEELKLMVSRGRPVRRDFLLKRGTELLRTIDKRIENISSQKPSQRREQQLKKMLRERTDVELSYFPRESENFGISAPGR